MICDNLLEEVLVKPAKQGANELFIVSGYASPSIAYYHLDLIPGNVNINLIVGMCPTDGIDKGSHESFKRLVTENSNGRFSCRYLTKTPPVHTKNYTWVKDDIPFISFTGSANYSRNAFFQNTREALSLDDPKKGLRYFKKLIPESMECTRKNISKYINIFKVSKRRISPKTKTDSPITGKPIEKLEKVELTLLAPNGSPSSGLNWAHGENRKIYNRNLNEAYIRVRAAIGRSNFFPKKKVFFNMITDDGQGFVCVKAGASGKHIETPSDNSILGLYFRKRLGLKSGVLVRPKDLERYGRSYVTIYRFDEDNYYLDFSAPKK